MLINLLLNFMVMTVGAIFSWLPTVETLPTIGGYDVDAALVTGMGQVMTFFNTFWPLKIMFQGFLFLLGYYAIKIGIRFFFGARSPI